jgi:LPXTG-motif cell wall-anchored protein
VRLNSDGSFEGSTTVPGTYTITVRACDPLGACADYAFTFTVARRLPSTGAESTTIATLAGMILGLGAVLMVAGRRRVSRARLG